jgi:hypothetical protein
MSGSASSNLRDDISHTLKLQRAGSIAISLLQTCSRNFMRMTLPIICDHLLALLLKYSAGQFNTLVNFESALLGLESQFSVGGNNHVIEPAL